MRNIRKYLPKHLSILLVFTILFSSIITPMQAIYAEQANETSNYNTYNIQTMETMTAKDSMTEIKDIGKSIKEYKSTVEDKKSAEQDDLKLVSSIYSNGKNEQVVTDSVYEREDTEVLVKFSDSGEADRIKKELKSKLKLSKLNFKKRIMASKLDVLEIGDNDNIDEVLKALKEEPSVEYVQPNYRVTYDYIPTDTQFNSQWALLNNGQTFNGQAGISGIDIDAVNAWNYTSGDRDIVIGVLDTGIDINHNDIKSNIYINSNEIDGNGIDDDGNGYVDDVNGWNFYNNSNSVFSLKSEDFHGTQVAGIIAAESDNGGIVGVAPNVKVLPLKFISGGYGYTSDAIEAIEYAKGLGVKIINCSWGGSDPNPALQDVMESSGIFFSCAAGNSSNDLALSPLYPACFEAENIISVAALDNQGNLAYFSNYGSQADIAAPGVNILSTFPGNNYALFNGTSAAAPFVTGVAALLSSMDSSMSTDIIKTKIIQGSESLSTLVGKVSSSGMLNANSVFGGGQTADQEQQTRQNIFLRV